MKPSIGRNWGWAVAALALVISASTSSAQPPADAQPDQRWQQAQNYSPGNPPNYQPPQGGNPPQYSQQNSPPTAPQYQYPQYQYPQYQYPQYQYPANDPRPAAPAGQSGYGNPPAGPGAYPQPDPRGQGMQAGPPGPGQQFPGQQLLGQQFPGQAQNAVKPPFMLAPAEAAELDRLLVDWERRNKEINVLKSKLYRWKYDLVFGNGNPAPEEGQLKFAAPDKGMIEINAKNPVQSEKWVCDGKSIYHFDYTQKVLTEFVLPPQMQGKGIVDGPLPFVFGIEAEKLKQRFSMKIITPPGVQNAVWLAARPRFQKQAAEFSEVEVILQVVGETKALLPYAIQVYSTNGKDRTVYQLQEPVINPRFDWVDRGWWNAGAAPNGWTKKTDLPPRAVQAELTPSFVPRR